MSNPYICERDGGLLILSYSGETYHANGACQCRAYASGRPCWHRACAQLVRRYNEALEAAQAAPVPPAETVAADERAQLISAVKAAHHRACPFESIALKLHRVFGVTKLEDVPTEGLHRILAALTPPPRRQHAPPPAPPVIAQRQALDACTKQRRIVGLDGWFKRRSGRAWNGWEV